MQSGEIKWIYRIKAVMDVKKKTILLISSVEVSGTDTKGNENEITRF